MTTFTIIPGGKSSAPGYTPRMSLRDGFAAAALQGILSGEKRWTDQPQKLSDVDRFARVAYALADAMLKQRDAP